VLLQVHRRNVGGNHIGRDDGLESLERHIELHRLLLGWLVLLRLIDEHERRVDLDGVVRLSSIQGRVHGRRDHQGVPYQGHGVQPERPFAVLGALGLDQVVEHG